MSSRNRKSSSRRSQRRYDTHMIRDFFEHLVCTWRLNQFGVTWAELSANNPELAERFARCQEKYPGSPAVCATRFAFAGNVNQDEVARHRPLFGHLLNDWAEEVVELLESIRPIVELGLEAADAGSRGIVGEIDTHETLAKSADQPS